MGPGTPGGRLHLTVRGSDGHIGPVLADTSLFIAVEDRRSLSGRELPLVTAGGSA